MDRMIARFPYGRPPLAILIIALVSGVAIWFLEARSREDPPDLVMATFARLHYDAYQKVIPEFEEQFQVKVQLQLVDQRALQSRLQAAMASGSPTPDVVELLENTMGFFTRGPLEDVGFLDLTERLKNDELYDTIVPSRYSLWTDRGHVFAIPHDVHPVMLAYRRDIVEDELGIDVAELKTWDDFVRIGREVSKDLTGDGFRDRFMLDLGLAAGEGALLLLLQRGGGLLDEHGNVIFDSPEAVEVIAWCVRQLMGPEPIAYPAGWGQTFARAINDGLVLFVFCPDWRAKMIEVDLPGLSGKMALTPLPAWTEGGRRSSTWGGTGLAITRDSPNPDLAWELARFLYFRLDDLAERFTDSYILPPVTDAWEHPAFATPVEYYSGQPIGKLFAEVAREIPAHFVGPHIQTAILRFEEVYVDAQLYYRTHGDKGLEEYIEQQLSRRARDVRRLVDRNVFLREEE